MQNSNNLCLERMQCVGIETLSLASFDTIWYKDMAGIEFLSMNKCRRLSKAPALHVIPVVAFDDVLKAFIPHELHGHLHAIQQGQHWCVGGLPILVGLDHVLKIIVHPLQLGLLPHLQRLHAKFVAYHV